VGAVALVASWLARSEPEGTQIGAIFPHGPERYFDTIYNDAYCAEHGLLEAKPEPEPDEIARPDEAEAVRWTRCTNVVDPAGESA
jgi:S-sulfo-L-cysteine synthase (3-phospho-L-serine-dependent)